MHTRPNHLPVMCCFMLAILSVVMMRGVHAHWPPCIRSTRVFDVKQEPIFLSPEYLFDQRGNIHILLLNISFGSPAMDSVFRMIDSLKTNPALRSGLYNHLHFTVLPVNNVNPQVDLDDYLATTQVDVIMGVIPRSVHSTRGVLSVDVLNLSTEELPHFPWITYLFPTVEQQIYVLANYVSQQSWLRDSGSADGVVVPLLFRYWVYPSSSHMRTIQSVYSNNGVDFRPMLVNTTTSMISSLQSRGVSVILGLAFLDVAPLLAFLESHPEAQVALLFDEFCMLYFDVVKGLRRPHMKEVGRQIIIITNLQSWSRRSDRGHRSDLVHRFATLAGDEWRSPMALRIFLAIFLIDSLVTSHLLSFQSTTHPIELALYSGEVLSVDDVVQFGPFVNFCLYPTTDHSLCLINSGARDIRVWTLSSLLTGDGEHVHGPMPAYVFLDPSHLLDVAHCTPLDVYTTAIFILIVGKLVSFVVLGCLCWCTSYLDDSPSLLTVLHVCVLRAPTYSIPPRDLNKSLQCYSDAVTDLVYQHQCVQLFQSYSGFAVLSMHPLDAIHLARDLHRVLSENSHLRLFFELRTGIHSEWCNASEAIHEWRFSKSSLSKIVPVATFAECVAYVAGSHEALFTQATMNALRDARKPTDLQYTWAGAYRLDKEAKTIHLFRSRFVECDIVEAGESSARQYERESVRSLYPRSEQPSTVDVSITSDERSVRVSSIE